MSGLVEKTLFESKENKKLLKNLRDTLRSKGMQLRVSYKTYDYNEEQNMDIKLYHVNSFGESLLYLRILTPHVLELKFGYSGIEYNADFIIEFALGIAKNLDASTLIIAKGSRVTIKNLPKLDFPNKEYTLFLNSYTSGDEFYYVNLERNYVENKIAFNEEIDNIISKFVTGDKTFVANKRRIVDGSEWSYYYKGFEGSFSVYYGKEILIESKELEYKKHVSSVMVIPGIVEEIMEKSYMQVKLMTLVNPPKKHFRQMIWNNIFNRTGSVDNEADQIFELLSGDYSPEELELGALDESVHKSKRIANAHSVRLFSLFGYYFVLDIGKQYDKYIDFETAKSVYEKLVLQNLEDEYQSKKINLLNQIANLKM